MGTSEKDLWAVGDLGLIRHWDGSTWSKPCGGTRADLNAVWGSGNADVWIVGDGAKEDYGVGGPGPADAGPSDTKGTVMHWDGAMLAVVKDVTPSGPRWSIWGSGSTDVWSSGGGSFPSTDALLHWNGTIWSTAGGYYFRAIWGSASNDVWGGGGTTQHWDGVGWTAKPLSSGGPPTGLWGSGAKDVWAVASPSILEHWDGTKWTPASKAVPGQLVFVSGSGAADVWSVGLAGLVAHYDGTTWSTVPSGTTIDLSGVWTSGAGDVWAVGAAGTILHWNGSSWAKLDGGTASDLAAVWGVDAKTVWVVGAGGTVLRRKL